MLCEHCHEKKAVINIAHVTENEKKSLNLCTECVQKMGMNSPLFDSSNLFGKLIVGILSEYLKSQDKNLSTIQEQSKRCSHCNLSWQKFEDDSVLGCPECYDVFHDELKVLLRRLHGNNQHAGKNMPGYLKTSAARVSDLAVLKTKLNHAVQAEHFEQAAIIRDQIKELQEKISTN